MCSYSSTVEPLNLYWFKNSSIVQLSIVSIETKAQYTQYLAIKVPQPSEPRSFNQGYSNKITQTSSLNLGPSTKVS